MNCLFQFLLLSRVAPHWLFYLFVCMYVEVNVGLSPLVSLQHYSHEQPHLNTTELQLHLIINRVR